MAVAIENMNEGKSPPWPEARRMTLLFHQLSTLIMPDEAKILKMRLKITYMISIRKPAMA